MMLKAHEQVESLGLIACHMLRPSNFVNIASQYARNFTYTLPFTYTIPTRASAHSVHLNGIPRVRGRIAKKPKVYYTHNFY